MRSPLGPVLADICMVELENNIVLVLQEHLSFWKRYVNDSICFVRTGTIICSHYLEKRHIKDTSRPCIPYLFKYCTSEERNRSFKESIS